MMNLPAQHAALFEPHSAKSEVGIASAAVMAVTRRMIERTLGGLNEGCVTGSLKRLIDRLNGLLDLR